MPRARSGVSKVSRPTPPSCWGCSLPHPISTTFASSPRRTARSWARELMRTSPWLSATLQRLNPRERRVVAAGAAVSAAALFLVLIVLPFAHRWVTREAAIAASREQWTRLQSLVSGESRLRRALDTVRLAQQSVRWRLLAGTTTAVAASHLQVLLQRYPDETQVHVGILDTVL